ncbi:MAG: hypothetical protein IJ454_03065, partial [Clostridia bacterium]|nr:hypothetical protein [Clostridia bacterium]
DNFLYSESTEEGYTNVVTAEDLNNIAIDLGLPEYSRFPEEPPQSAVAALNGITQDLTSKGVLQIGSCMNVTIADGIISVADGVCVMESGAKKRLTEAVSFPYIEGGTNYVYLFNNVSGNQIQLICSLEAPTDGTDYVMLAEVTASSVTDKRYWSISKVGNGVNIAKEITQTFVFLNNDDDGNRRYSVYEYDISQCGSNFFIYQATGDYYTDKIPIAIALEEGVEIEHWINSGYFPDQTLFFLKEGGKLYIKASTDTTRYSSSSRTITFWLA